MPPHWQELSRKITRKKSASFVFKSLLVLYVVSQSILFAWFHRHEDHQRSSSISVVRDALNKFRLLLPTKKWQLPTNTESSDDDAMAACLLMKDDNHLLIEWIAYHYLTLPLRYLVIAIDPDSFTSPNYIIQRWNQTYMDIRLWRDSDYMNQTNLAIRLRRYALAKELNNITKQREDLVQLHRDRQALFVSECSLFHKSRGRSWVAHFDTDEYIVFNYLHHQNQKNNNHQMPYNKAREKLPLISQDNVTVLQVMNRVAKDYSPQWSNKGCMAMVRVLFGPRQQEEDRRPENQSNNISAATLELKNFSTLRYYYHSKVGKKTINGLQKVLINVAKHPNNFLDYFFSIHRPSKILCPPEYYRPKSFADSLLKIHHYLGSWEQYNARPSDVRRKNRAWYDEKARASSEEGPNYDIQPWMERFVRMMGAEKSRYLLQGVGDYSTAIPVVYSDTRCALIFFGVPRLFASKVFPSIKKFILEVNPNCHVFIHSYNVSTVVGNRMGEKSSSMNNSINVTEILTSFNQYYQETHQLQKNIYYELKLETEQDFQRQRNVTYFRQFFPRPSHWEYPNSMDNMIRQWHSIESGWNLMETYENKMRSRFARVGFFRLDVLYTHPINVTTSSLAVIPAMMYTLKQPSGINDRLFYGARDVGAIWATERFNSVDDYLSWQSQNIDKVHSYGLHSEEFLRYLLVQKWSLGDLITLRNICIQRVRTTGKILKSDCYVYGKNMSGEQTVRGAIVLGMHRSGTSLLSGLLVRGLSYHSPGEHIPANEQNPYGFFENVDVCRQNDVWLREQGRAWNRLGLQTSATNSSVLVRMFRPTLSCSTDSCLTSDKKPRSPPSQYFMHRDKALFYYNDPAITPWILKDPRLCLTLKLWLPILNGANPAVIFTYRNPLEVARSLKARSVKQIKVISNGLRLWIWYNRMALENSKGLCRIVTSNERIMQDPLREMQRIGKELVSCGLAKRPINATAVKEFINKDFMHITSSEDLVNCTIPRFQSDLTDPDAKEAEEVLYSVAMKVYCDLQRGDAFKDDYNWPIL